MSEPKYVLHPEIDLPPKLDAGAVRRAVDYIEREAAGLIDLYHEQANVFSAVVGIFGAKALDSFSAYEKHRHADMAQQRFPDLHMKGSGPAPKPIHCLESKGSKRPWNLQSHYDHEGWYIVWRYLVDTTETIEAGKPVIVWRVDVVYLKKEDWKYEGSKAGSGGGGRTHTFGVRNPKTMIFGKAIYERTDIKVVGDKAVPINGA